MKVTVYKVNTDGNPGSSITPAVTFSCSTSSPNNSVATGYFKPSDLNIDADTGMRKAIIKVENNGGTFRGKAAFTVTTGAGGGRVSLGLLGGYDAGYDPNYLNNGYRNFTVPFGTCDSSGRKRLEVYDLDNKTTGIQPEDAEFYVSRGSGDTPLQKNEYESVSSDLTVKTISGSGNTAQVSFVPHKPDPATPVISWVDMKSVDVGQKYVLRVNHIYWNNTFRIKLPAATDEVISDLECWRVKPSIKIKDNDKNTTFGTSDITTAPGKTITWRSTITEERNKQDSKRITWGVGSENTSSAIANVFRDAVGIGREKWANSLLKGGNANNDTAYQIPPGTADGTKYCLTTYSKPFTASDDTQQSSATRCATVKNTWTIRPEAAMLINNTGGWTYSTSSTSTQTREVPVGQSVEWRYRFTFTTGSTTSSDTVTYGSDVTNNATTCSKAGGAPAWDSCKYTWTPSSVSDIGTTRCNRAYVNRSSGPAPFGAKTASPYLCATVILPWSITPKTSMRITAGNTTSGAWVTSASGSDYNSGSGWYYDERNYTNGATKINVRPNQTVEWRHMVKQNGPLATNQEIWAHSDFQPKDTIKTNIPITDPRNPTPTNGNFPHGAEGHSANWTVRSGWAAGGLGWYNPIGIWASETRSFTQDDVSDDVNKVFCSRLTAGPRQYGLGSVSASPSSNLINSGDHCVRIPYHYELRPNTTLEKNSVEIGEPVEFKYEVDNRGETKSKDTTFWYMTFYVPPDQAGGGTPAFTCPGETAYCDFATTASYPNNRWLGKVNQIATPSDSRVFDKIKMLDLAKGENLSGTLTVDTSDMQLGGMVCSYLVVYNKQYVNGVAAASNPYRASSTKCAKIAKHPQIQLRGADSKSGATQFGTTVLTKDGTVGAAGGEAKNEYQGGFEGSSSSNPARGSWSQYGLLATGDGIIKDFGSSGYTFHSDNRGKACKLLFANTDEGGSNCTGPGAIGESYGQMGTKRIITLPEVAKAKSVDSLPAKSNKLTSDEVSLGGLSSGTYYAAGDLTIQGSTLSPGQHLVIIAPEEDKSITIDGNITDGGKTYDSLEEIPSLTVIADKIYVKGSVTQLFGTYIARDRFSTCWEGRSGGAANRFALAGIGRVAAGELNSGACNKQLTITGAVISKNRPYFLRTFGAGKDAEASIPSEIFNYTPNLYLTPYALSQSSANNWTMTDLRQLPARL